MLIKYCTFKRLTFVLATIFLISSLFSCSNRAIKEQPRIQEELELTENKSRILYIDSYNTDLPWVQGITRGIFEGLNITLDEYGNPDSSMSNVELKILHMDTKINQSEEFIKAAAFEAKQLIESWRPDVVIASDDNASKHLIVPFFKDSELPFVFCGINWDASVYGFPSNNVTGMVEVSLIPELIDELILYSKGSRVGFLKGDSLSSRREGEEYEKVLGYEIEKVYVDNLSEWKEAFLSMQQQVDILLLGNLAAVQGWDEDEESLQRFVLEESVLPSGAWDSWMAEAVLVTFANQPEEQGEWAAFAALQILSGKSPSEIPLVKNKKAVVFLNMKLAKKMDIRFSQKILDRAHLVNDASGNKKILFVNSYHKGYVWSDEIEKGFLKSLDKYNDDLDIRIIRMDTKNNNSEAFIETAVQKVRNEIETWKPDVVAGSDDNFSKYVITPFYKGSDIPFVFCGVNWDASEYGFPVSNVTGMIEVDPFVDIVEILSDYADGPRLGALLQDGLSTRKIITNVEAAGDLVFSEKLIVRTFEEWKQAYLELQDSVDSFILFNPIGLEGWNEEEALIFIYENSEIPTGISVAGQIHYVLLGQAKVAEEQGWWTGNTVLRILEGTPVRDIPIVRNQQSTLIVNMKLANKMGIKFFPDIMENAVLWNDYSPEVSE
jgi:ABC-type uncharacterized transport system substrate-binding protein